ncbi:macro domain-containing protein [Phytoactinopolyspora endophytica]|uniref:macro domain-containing protein n=1 Tax=Phytoactinopolyspora endophytica TaxID=1642495 RepID=UPI00101DB984|nr:macro domain-containing protein [Phytoactinopolyspora endophytica]
MTSTVFEDIKRRRFWRHFAIHTFSGVGFCAVFAGLFDVLFPDVVSDGGRPLAVLLLLLSSLYGLWRSWPRPIEQIYDAPNIKIGLVRGNLFEQRDHHLVIGMATTFDTEVPEVIARSSVQAQFMREVYQENRSALDADLAAALSEVPPTGKIEKKGKTAVYPIGTVAVLNDRYRRLFCVAYAEMNEKNEARGSVGGVWQSLEQLWRSVATHANGGTVAMPVIGGGQARLSQILPAQDSIRFTILSFMLASRREKICDELKIVVQPKEFDRLDRLELQSFLKSLRVS